VPVNYNALELNEARINWFSASTNYNQVVTQAANDAGGQGFVTEMAGATSPLSGAIWSPSNEAVWEQAKQEPGPLAAYRTVVDAFAGLDGLNDVIAAHATFSSGVDPQQLKNCPQCYVPTSVDDGFLDAVEADVIGPMRVVQKLIDAHPQITRLYTTMSAGEMTVDPLFSFNADLQPVSNVHTADRVIECSKSYYESTAPWRIELPQGGVIRGGPTTLGTWPTAFDAQPANRRILRQGESGNGRVLEDNSATIQSALTDYGKTVNVQPTNMPGGGCGFGAAPPSSGIWAGVLIGLGVLVRRRDRNRASQH
jgi:hypothetical protein